MTETSAPNPRPDPNARWDAERLWTDQQTADYVQMTRGGLANLRLKRKGPPYSRLGRSIRYRPADVKAWVESQLVNTAA